MQKLGLLVRCLGSLLLGAISLKLLLRAMTSTNYMEAFAISLFGLAALITTVLLLAPELADFFAAPLSRAVGGLLFPQGSEKPPVDYILSRMYLKQGRYEESCSEYLKILEYHPKELNAYLEGISAAHRWNNPQVARQFYRKGLSRLHSPEAADQLKLAYRSTVQPAIMVSSEEGGG